MSCSNGRTEIIVVGGGPGNSAASIKIPGYGRLQDRPKWPGTSPASAVNNPRPWNEQGDYVTPTPLPYRPQWGIKQWVEYFKDHHPNFYMHEQLRKNMTMVSTTLKMRHTRTRTLSCVLICCRLKSIDRRCQAEMRGLAKANCRRRLRLRRRCPRTKRRRPRQRLSHQLP